MLRTVIAAAFKSKGRKSMSKSELTYVLSFDLKWFSHDKSRQIVELAIEKGLLSEEEGGGDGKDEQAQQDIDPFPKARFQGFHFTRTRSCIAGSFIPSSFSAIRLILCGHRSI